MERRASWRGTGQPQAQAVSQPVAEPVDPQWWTLFNDKQLTGLEQRLAEANLDVRVASIRLAEARAAVGVAAAAGLPSVNGNASYTRQQLSQKGALSLVSTGTAASQSNGASQAQNGAEVPNVGIFQPFNLFQYRLRCLVGGRYLGPGAAQRRIGRRQRGRQRGCPPRHAADRFGGTRARLHPAARGAAQYRHHRPEPRHRAAEPRR